ncbi:transcription cofactor vestigial-like protein 4 isoform X2 [Rhinichthys klamathensis goyatoka]|uniref:transcription cofactor vestigial-like protein 4 isoform X2 n=1 Tax=Rhinichthys klamathensis goyatoka TaxID=3034132 RepID=UPI0024B492BD|nr:transcription cofactor vestigial-like protein 4 isoform X2 [Rhinichthys klamathensis goyatoka]
MHILMNRFVNKMNNNISRLHCNPYEDASRVLLNSGCQPVSQTKRKHHENEDSDEEHMIKMRSHLNPGDAVNAESWNRSAFGDVSVSRRVSPAMEKNTHRSHTLLSPGSRSKPQQNRPSVITCAPASRPCSLSSCHMCPHACTSASTSQTTGRSSTTDCAITNSECDPVIEEHFRRSLGQVYEEPVSDLSITGSVDAHFTKALGDAWTQIKARGHAGTDPNHEGRC